MVHPRPPRRDAGVPTCVASGRTYICTSRETRRTPVLRGGARARGACLWLGPILLNEEQGGRQVAKLRLVFNKGLGQARRQGVCCWEREICEQLLERLKGGQREQCGKVVRLASEEDSAGRDGHWRGGTQGRVRRSRRCVVGDSVLP